MQMKKTILLTILLIITLITLCGCVNVDYATTINKDGSGEVAFIYSLNKSVITSLGKNNIYAIENMKKNAEDAGYSVEDYEDGETTGFKASKKVDDITKKSYISEIFEQYVENEEESKINIKNHLFGKTYSQKAIINLESVEQLKELGAKVSYTVNLPTKVSKTNANNISKDKKTITWNIDFGTTEEISFVAKTRTGLFLDIYSSFSLNSSSSNLYTFK